ncbi:sigma factor-like helix-turn-helix DNA-binding protein [Nocardioides aquiterrae]|uniref:RNA polymerase sigma factor 70 region 4 type 2 domain-containing protein n=1 Tax=Nocardioides aquiterrae TaxID=203799 RepID=A0ABN1UHX4_9ACTN
MPGDDADFEAYLAARWPSLVRSLVLIGLPPGEAEDVVVTGMARCRTAWRRLHDVDDVDAHAYGLVLDGLPRPVAVAANVPADLPTEAEALRHQLEEQLALLAPAQREAVVLHLVAGLDEQQVADVLDVPLEGVAHDLRDGLALIQPATLRSETAFRTAAGAVDVSPAPYDAVVARAREQRRRRLRIVVAAVAAGAVVLGGATWLANRSGEPARPEPDFHVVPSRNPIDIGWYDGRLHLRQVTVEIPGVTALAGIGESAVFVDTGGAVGIVSPAGEVDMVGRTSVGSTILGSAENGWAAWLEPGDPGTRIVVWSIGLGAELGSLLVPPETRLIAIDQDRVYSTSDNGSVAWQPTQEQPVPLPDPGLVDVGTATRVYQQGRRIEMVQPFFSVSFVRRGEGAIVSPGGNFVLTRIPGPWTPGAPYTPLIYSTRSGDRLPSGIAPDERVVDAAFGSNHEVDYLVANLSDLQGVDLDGARARLYVLRTCELEANVCSDVAPVRSAADRAMFAQ